MLAFRLLPILLPALVPAQAPKWTTFTAKEDGFSVLLPAKPKMTAMTNGAQGVTATMRNYVARTSSVTCATMRVKFSDNVTPRIMANVSNGIKKGLLGSIQGTATGDRKAAFGGRTGRQVDFKAASGGAGSMWMVETPGHTMFILMIAGPKVPTDADRKRFFASLRP